MRTHGLKEDLNHTEVYIITFEGVMVLRWHYSWPPQSKVLYVRMHSAWRDGGGGSIGICMAFLFRRHACRFQPYFVKCFGKIYAQKVQFDKKKYKPDKRKEFWAWTKWGKKNRNCQQNFVWKGKRRVVPGGPAARCRCSLCIGEVLRGIGEWSFLWAATAPCAAAAAIWLAVMWAGVGMAP